MKLRYKILGAVFVLSAAAVTTVGVSLSHDTPCGAVQTSAAGASAMNAIVSRCYGSPDVLTLEKIPQPPLADDRMLVKVRAASVNPLDWHYMRGDPYLVRFESGLGTPKNIHTGVDFAGTVVSVGKNVTRFKPGDAVFGGKNGAFGEYVSVADKGSIAMKPTNMSFEQAAAVPIAAITALQALRDKGKVKAGQTVLINGASGGVGTYAVQIAKAYGATVTGVCSTRNVQMVRSIGADTVIDYTHEDFTKNAQQYDLILDTVGTHSPSDYRRVLKPQGALVMVGSLDKGHWLGPLSGSLFLWMYSHFISQQMDFMLAELNPQDLDVLRGMIEAGKIQSVIDKDYTLREVPDAMRYLELGHARGKVVITVANSDSDAPSGSGGAAPAAGIM